MSRAPKYLARRGPGIARERTAAEIAAAGEEETFRVCSRAIEAKVHARLVVEGIRVFVRPSVVEYGRGLGQRRPDPDNVRLHYAVKHDVRVQQVITEEADAAANV